MSDPDFTRRLAAAQDEMLAAGFKPSHTNPHLFKLLGRLGLNIRPPHYQPFAVNVLIYGWFFGIFWGIAMYWLVWRANDMPVPVATAFGASAGLLFGILMSAFTLWQRRSKSLSRWQDL